MRAYKVQQRHLAHRGRDFHFVSYDAAPADARHHAEAVPAMWYLMAAGKRWAAFPQRVGQPEGELEAELRDWVDRHVFGAGA